MFCYLPFEHAESPEAREISVRAYTTLREDTGGAVDGVEWAVKHREIIARFGRFPHRNAVLGRASTDEELAFLKQPGSSFGECRPPVAFAPLPAEPSARPDCL